VKIKEKMLGMAIVLAAAGALLGHSCWSVVVLAIQSLVA
jgi:hypothetical protein